MTGLAQFDLQGRNAVVTGAAMGIGAGIAAALHDSGAAVTLVDIDIEAAERTAAALGGPASARAVHADVKSPEAMESVLEDAASHFGSLDVVVNNAGIYPTRSIEEITPELFDSVLRTNLWSTMFACRAAARIMGPRSSGSIVNVASLEGLKPSMPGLTMYGASKGGVIALTRHMALELAQFGIRVNAIAPGAILTEGSARMTESSNMTEEDRQEMLKAFEDRIPLTRLGQPGDLGGAAVFLASEASAYVTGIVIPVDGGLLLV